MTSSRRPDFLRRLIERSIDAPGAIEPRLPSLFERASWSPTMRPEGDAAAVSTETATGALRAMPADPPAMPLRPSTYPPNYQGDRYEPAARVVPTPPTPRSEASNTRSLPAAAPPSGEAVTRTIVLERLLRTSDVLNSRPTHLDATEQPRERPAIHTDAAANTARTAAPPHTSDASDGAFKPEPLRRAPDEHIVAELPGVLASIASLRDPVSAAANRSEPVVNVTIGRLEIRALQSPKASGKPMPSSALQPMSLNDYLQQRSRTR